MTTRRIYGPAQVATGPTTIYTAPTGIRAVLKTIHVSNPSGSPVTLTVTIGADAAGTRFIGSYNVPAASPGSESVKVFYPGMPVEPAEIVTVSAGTNNVLVIAIAAELVAT